jgi:phospholipid/cholesterol/gamma-HCH transport system ATP-binding protein
MSETRRRSPEGPAVRVTDLRCQYGDFVVMDHIDFEVQHGEVFVILGGSGCGKSTLLKNLVGLVTPGAGDIEILGRSLVQAHGEERDSILRSFGMMFQGGALFSSMTLAENVALPLREFTELPEAAIAQLVKMKLELVNLGGYETFYPSEISGGMMKRAAVARALALDPELLFFDEPSAGLDPSTGAELDELILGLRDTLGTTMVIVTHELQSIYAVADRCIVLDKARKTMIATGKPSDLRDTSTDPYVLAFFRREPLRETA